MDDLTEYKKEGFERQKLFRLPMRAEFRMLDRPFTCDIVVTDIGYYPRAERHLVERKEALKSHVLVFCLKGRGWFSCEGRRREVRQMDVFCIPAGKPHAYGSSSTDPWEIYWVHVYGKAIVGLLEWTPLRRNCMMTSFSNANALRRQFNAILQRLEAGYTDHTLLEMSRFFVNLTTLLHVDAGPLREVQQRERIEEAMDKMRQTLSKPMSLQTYAKSVGFSVSQFSFLFNRHYGTSPMAYFTELRMQRAKALLDSTSLSIKEVAWESGFEDQLYFSRIFKRVSGISPTAYRMEHTSVADTP